jgi:hypothetical protein
MPESDERLANFASQHEGAPVFVCGSAGARVLLAVRPHRLYFAFEGEAESSQIIDTLRQARETGLLTTDDFSAFVDMAGFTGALDWRAIAEIGEVMPKGDCTTNKNAYVVNDGITASLTKINSALFSKTEHRAFTVAAEALAWLGWT